MQEKCKSLIQAVESEIGKQMKTPADFDRLAERVETRTRERISASTLMRLWGYRSGVTTRETTLDILARYLGHTDFISFCTNSAKDAAGSQSDEILSKHLYTSELQVGQSLVLTWHPNRRCLIRLCQDNVFEIIEAENTKLSVGDTFHCDIFIEGETLYLSHLIHEGHPPTLYAAGKMGGIKFELCL